MIRRREAEDVVMGICDGGILYAGKKMRYLAKTTKQAGVREESDVAQTDVMQTDVVQADELAVVSFGPFTFATHCRSCCKSFFSGKRQQITVQVLAALFTLSCIAVDYSSRNWLCHWYQLSQWPGVEAMGGGPLVLEGVINNENGQAVPGSQVQVGYCECVPSTRHDMPGRVEREVWITADDQGRFKFEAMGIWARVKQVRFADGFTLRPIHHHASNSAALPQAMAGDTLSGSGQMWALNRLLHSPHVELRTLPICDLNDQSHLHSHSPLVVYPFTKRVKRTQEAMVLVRFDGDCQLAHSGLAHLDDLEVVNE